MTWGKFINSSAGCEIDIMYLYVVELSAKHVPEGQLVHKTLNDVSWLRWPSSEIDLEEVLLLDAVVLS